MFRGTRIAATLGVVVVLLASGCGTASENPLAPDAASRDIGSGLGMGGNVAGESTTQSDPPPPIAPTDTTTRRGGGLGMGGN